MSDCWICDIHGEIGGHKHEPWPDEPEMQGRMDFVGEIDVALEQEKGRRMEALQCAVQIVKPGCNPAEAIKVAMEFLKWINAAGG